MLPVSVVRCSIYFSLWWIHAAGSSNLTVLCLFDSDIATSCQDILMDVSNFQSGLTDIVVETRTLKANPDFNTMVTEIKDYVNAGAPDVIFTVGSFHAANAASLFARQLIIPQVSLIKDSMAYPLYSATFTRFGPSGEDLAETFYYLINMQNTSDISLIYQTENAYDEFVYNLRDHILRNSNIKRFRIFGSPNGVCEDEKFVRKLIELRDNGSRMIILHAGPTVTKLILRCAVKLDLFQSGHVWISTSPQFSNQREMTDFPVGILATEYSPSHGFQDEIREGLTIIISTWKSVIKSNTTEECSFDTSVFGNTFRFLRHLDKNWRQPKVSYSLINLAQEDEGQSIWRKVGILQRDLVTVETIIWPGGFIYGPIAKQKKFLRVATVPAPPFVQYRQPDNEDQNCYTDTPCLELKKMDRIIAYLDAFKKGGPTSDQQYNFSCCSGLSIDLLNRISKDLNFEFVLYFFPDTVNRIGKLVNGTWDGAIGDVYHGTADIMIGALSITSERSMWIDFTVPFYQSGFTMLSVMQENVPDIGAFLLPFSTEVWVSIAGVATITAIVSSYLEWKSPFGLNPWGRDRNGKYTLGSAIVMVYSVAFGHTFATKSPKSWPCRFVLNVWSTFAIFMIASYTANLAAFLAGKENDVFYRSPQEMLRANRRVGVIGEASVTGFIKKLYPELYVKMKKTSVRTTAGMIKLMKQNDFDIFIHDLPLLEYARARLDGDCNLRIVGSTFGEDGYGIGLPKRSEWKAPMSDLILSYGLSGFLEDLERQHFSELTCSSNVVTQQNLQYGMIHTGGLFIMLGVAIVISILLLVIEHFFYRHCLPRLRSKPTESIFKHPHMMFFSQRLYRATTSEDIVPSLHGAKEILTRVKNKQFIELFQKEQRKAAALLSTHSPSTLRCKQCLALTSLPRRNELERAEHLVPRNLHTPTRIPGTPSHIQDGENTTTNNKVVLDDTGSVVGDIELNRIEAETVSLDSSLMSDHLIASQVTPDLPDDDWPSHWEEEWVTDSLNATITGSDERELDMGHINGCFVMNNEREENKSGLKRNISLKETDRVRNPHSSTQGANIVKSYSWRLPKDFTTLSENVGRSHIAQLKKKRMLSDGNICRKLTNLKDNRTKSRLRRNTLEHLCRTFSVDLIDSFTLDSLSKSDLLVLWKASEINLRQQLEEMTRQKETLLVLIETEDNHSMEEGISENVSTIDSNPELPYTSHL